MNTHKFFVGRAIGFLVVIVVILLVIGYKKYLAPKNNENMQQSTVSEITTTNSQPKSFAWQFEQDDSLNLDGLPQTNVILAVTYADDTTRTLAIDTVPGSCNPLPDSNVDSVAGVSDVQCYSAGMGQRYILTKDETAYRVQRKLFEEALPNYESPVYTYETLVVIPLEDTK